MEWLVRSLFASAAKPSVSRETTTVHHAVTYVVHSSPVDPASSTPRRKTHPRRISPRRRFARVGVLASTTTRTSPPTTVQTYSHHRQSRPPPPLPRSSPTRRRRATKKSSFAAEPTNGDSPRYVFFVVRQPRGVASASSANAKTTHRVVVEHPSPSPSSRWLSSASWSTDVAL